MKLDTDIDRRLAALTKEVSELRETHETRIAALEGSAMLFEENRQSRIRLNEQLKELKEEMDRDDMKLAARDAALMRGRSRRDEMIAGSTIKTEDRALVVLFDMVLEHCTDDKGRLDSRGRAPYSHALRLLAEAEFIRIDEENTHYILATPLPKRDPA